jgi:membrane protease YdiL (CAAX protease family)
MWKEHDVSPITSFVKRYPFVAFALLSYLLSWWPALVPGFEESVGIGILPHGPSIAAIVVMAIVGGRPAVRRLLSRLLRWRIGLKWYVIAIGLTILITVSAVVLNVLLGAAAPTEEELSGWAELPFSFIFLFLLAGAAEELGWRGFAQPHLQQKYSALTSALILSVVGVVWHLPLFLTGSIELPDVPLIFAGYIVYAWLFNSTGGSVLITMVAHATNNTLSGEFFSPMFQGNDAVRQSALLAILWIAAAVFVTLRAGVNLGREAGPVGEPMVVDQPLLAAK